jgi:hypothetical protein
VRKDLLLFYNFALELIEGKFAPNNIDGAKDILGLQIERSEGVKFWLLIMNEKGFPDAIMRFSPAAKRRGASSPEGPRTQISSDRLELAPNLESRHPVLCVPEAVRRIIYTTKAIEALNSKLRRAVRTRGHFPSRDAATKLLYFP